MDLYSLKIRGFILVIFYYQKTNKILKICYAKNIVQIIKQSKDDDNYESATLIN